MFKKRLHRLILLLCISTLVLAYSYRKSFRKWNYFRTVENHLAPYKKTVFHKAEEVIPNLPIQLRPLPLSDDLNIVLNVQTISIPQVHNPYNASLIENDKDGYFLFFRIDGFPRESQIAYVELDHTFQQTSDKIYVVETCDSTSEDPRVISDNNEAYLVYNEKDANFRSMRIAGLKMGNQSLDFITPLALKKKKIEKNWAPFIHEDVLFFEYFLNPHTILKLSDVKDAQTLSIAYHSKIWGLEWPSIWGELRGGTPPRKICHEGKEQYLGFFHSTFRCEKKKMWYVMGAYTFETKPPFRITAISPHPILFKGIYESPLKIATHCIFPCGFVCEHKEGKDLIHVSCGENDTTIKIVTFDQKPLLKSLLPLKIKYFN